MDRNLPNNPDALDAYVNRMLGENPSEIPQGSYAYQLPAPAKEEDNDNG